jgi:membrane fusion protein, multidrug efflux system
LINDARKKWIVPLFGSLCVLLCVVGAGAGLYYFKAWQLAQMAKQKEPPEPATTVSVTEAKPVSFRQHSSAIGTIVAPQSITLSNEIAGTVSQAELSAGAIVEAGTVLLQLDTSIETAQLTSARSAANLSRSKLKRTSDAYRANALTATELEEAKNELTQATAKVAELKALIKKKTLTAPFPARVGLSDTHVGQYLPAGTVITSLQGVQDYLYVDFTMPQKVAQAVEVGQSVTLISGQTTFNAIVEAFDSRADKRTRNLMARARLSSAPAFMKPGDSVKVLIEYGPEIHAVAVPAEAVRRTPTDTLVFVAHKDDNGNLRALPRSVEVIQTLGNDVAIYSGIQAGEQVVDSGSFKLMEGGLLQVIGKPTATGSASQHNES